MWKENEIPSESKKTFEIVQELKEIEKQEKTKENITGIINPSSLWAGISYVGSPDANIWKDLKNQTTSHNRHEKNSPFNNLCLGCLCGERNHGTPNYNFSQTYHFSSGGKLVLKTQSGVQELKIPSEGGAVKFEICGNKVSLVLESNNNKNE